MSDPLYVLSLYVFLAYASMIGTLLIIWQFKHRENEEEKISSLAL